MEQTHLPTLFWIVAGKRGMELWGYNSESDFHPDRVPDARIKISPLHWDFSFTGHDGSGRVRIGAGCQYNPLQMVESLYTHLNMAESNTTVIEIDLDMADAIWSPDTPFGDDFASDWE